MKLCLNKSFASPVLWVGGFFLATSTPVSAVLLELGPAADGYATDTQVINDAIFSVDTGPGGSGNFGPFMKLQRAGNGTTALGHNSDLTPANDEKSGQELQSLQLFNTPLNELDPNTDYAGKASFVQGRYLEIRFDINRSQSGQSLKSTNFAELQFWLSPTAMTTPYDYTANGNLDPDDYEAANGAGTAGMGTKFWDLDEGEDRNLRVGQSNSGSGSYDGIMFIPLDAIIDAVPSATGSYYLTMWSRLVDVDSGFDEYATIVPDGSQTGVFYLTETELVPEPSSFSLLLGLAAISVVARRRNLR